MEAEWKYYLGSSYKGSNQHLIWPFKNNHAYVMQILILLQIGSMLASGSRALITEPPPWGGGEEGEEGQGEGKRGRENGR